MSCQVTRVPASVRSWTSRVRSGGNPLIWEYPMSIGRYRNWHNDANASFMVPCVMGLPYVIGRWGEGRAGWSVALKMVALGERHGFQAAVNSQSAQDILHVVSHRGGTDEQQGRRGLRIHARSHA